MENQEFLGALQCFEGDVWSCKNADAWPTPEQLSQSLWRQDLGISFWMILPHTVDEHHLAEMRMMTSANVC